MSEGNTTGHSASPDAITAEALRAAFPGWRIYPSGGCWFAMRPGTQEWTGPRSLLCRALFAPDMTGLVGKLCRQEHLDGLAEDELAAVWRAKKLPPR